MSGGFPYKESLLHWIWEHHEFDYRGLQTDCGKELSVLTPGVLNKGKGPDFLNARIRIGSLLFAGHVEIHADEAEWNSHLHQHDPAYNNVVLHVIYDRPSVTPVLRFDNTGIPVLRLRNYLQKPLDALLAGSRAGEIPCAKHLHFINQQAFEKQLEAVHLDYLEYKTEELLQFYDPALPVSEAWKTCFITGIYHTLGMPGNRDSMVQLYRDAGKGAAACSNAEGAADYMFGKAFSGEGRSRYRWDEFGQRPASKPGPRVRQAAVLQYLVTHHPLKSWLTGGTYAWKKIIAAPNNRQLPGPGTLNLLYNTICLPSVWLLGNLLHSDVLKEEAFRQWQQTPQKVPSSILKPFIEAGFAIPASLKKSGLAHQYKRYCQAGKCQSCYVFKSAIRS